MTSFRGLLKYFTVAACVLCSVKTVSAASDSGFKNRTTVLLAGDSIMEQATEPSVDGFISLLAGRYSRSADMIVRALSGYNTRWYLKYAMPGIEEEITRGDYNPALITLWLGANDAVLINEICCGTNRLQEGVVGPVQRPYARACVEAAKEAGVSVLDLYSHFDAMTVTARDKLLVDGVHFNAAGHLVVDEKLRATILKEFPEVNDLLDTYQFPIVSRWMKDDPYVPETTK
ncbi:GDSL-like Lipase/Acylhydrolase family [Phytophthora infestans]|uniref:GDSL-like Lipase/Acylhydrolase family n=1 Tax=Phytophthora infestans TaxID=4787 RepID=A0A8S9TTA2_PHYIN|nr:GDSL-like Lipase/Acylhydrolase family [Phytophthora infestans]